MIDLFRQTRELGITLNCTISGCCVALRPHEREKWENSPECWCIEEHRLQASAAISHLKRQTRDGVTDVFVPIQNGVDPVQFVPCQSENIDPETCKIKTTSAPKILKPKLSAEELERKKKLKLEAKRQKLAAALARVKQRKLKAKMKKNGTRWGS